MSDRDEWFEHECELKHETDKAYLLEIEGEELWFPKSKVQLVPKPDGTYNILAPKWLLEKKGLNV